MGSIGQEVFLWNFTQMGLEFWLIQDKTMNNTLTFENIFRSRMFRIPDYQRGYAWEVRHVNDLIEDLELLLPGHTHYTGTLVVRHTDEAKLRDENGLAYEIFDVIDGQQRLTTIVLFLDVLHDEFERLNKKELADGLRKTYLSVLDRNGFPHTKLTLNRDCQEFFYNDVLGFSRTVSGPRTRSHSNLLDAHARIEDYVLRNREKSGDGYEDWLFEMYEKITQGLTVLLYEVENEIDAGVIFETMNDRGKELTDLEKIKNHFLYIASKLELPESHDLNEKINRIWNILFEELMSSGLGTDENEEQLLRTHWLMTCDPVPQNWKRFKSVKEYFSLKRYKNNHAQLLKDIFEYLESLLNTVISFCDIHNPNRDGSFREITDTNLRNQILNYSEKLVRLGTRATFIPLLSAIRLRAPDNGITYLQVLKLCEIFDFRVYQWLRGRSYTAQSAFFRLAYQFYKNPSPARVISSITRTTLEYCPDAGFLDRFEHESENWYHWSGLKYFLYEYELFLAEKAREPVHIHWADILDTKRDSIEHILPQTPGDSWKEAFPDEAKRRRWMHDIGNLTLTYDNSSLQNKSFLEKRGQPSLPSCYCSSSFFIERQLTRYSCWTEKEMIERREEMKAWAVTRWALDETGLLPVDEIPDGPERIRRLAENGGVEGEFNAICQFAEQHSLNLRLYKQSIAITPADNHNVSLVTIWPENGYLRISLWKSNFNNQPCLAEKFNEIFNTTEEKTNIIVTSANIEDFMTTLGELWN